MAAIGQDNGLRERLTSAQRRVSSLRDQRAEARREREEAKRVWDNALRSGGGKLDSAEFSALERARARVGAVADELEDAQQGVLNLVAQMSGGSPAQGASGRPVARVRRCCSSRLCSRH